MNDSVLMDLPAVACVGLSSMNQKRHAKISSTPPTQSVHSCLYCPASSILDPELEMENECGGLTVAINALFMQFYVGGVSCPYICSRNQDHGVLLVGYGSEGYSPIRLKNKPYWIIKNSWGQNWGDQGYYKICRGRNMCGVESQVSTVTVATSVHPPDQIISP